MANDGRSGPRAAELDALRAALATHPVVNLYGPPGIGKSALARRLGGVTVDLADGPVTAWPPPRPVDGPVTAWPPPRPADGPLIVDSVDGPERAAAARVLLDAATATDPRPGTGATTARRPGLLLVSRCPLAATDGWTSAPAAAPGTAGVPVAALPLAPLPGPAVDALAAGAGIDDPAARALVVRLAAGVPLLAAAACRALHAGAAPDDEGAVADHIADELAERLGRELAASRDPGSPTTPALPGPRALHALRLLATVGAGDEQLLSAGPDLFTGLARLSVVTRTPLGLAVREPYRTVLETAYRWRRPLAHHTLRTRAAAYRHTLLARTRDAAVRAELVRQGLFLTGDPGLRASLFPAAESAVRITSGRDDSDADSDDIARLMHRWARRGGFAASRAERVTERWLAHGASVFRVARDGEGRAVALAALLPLADGTSDALEPLLQQHTGRFLGGRAPGGLFLGAAYATDPAAHARILHDILGNAVRAGHLVVSTATADYQLLVRGLGFRVHGSVRDDVYRCGRPPEVFSNAFTPAALPLWLDRLGGGGPAGAGAEAPDEHLVAEVTRALSRVHDPFALAGSPLLDCPATPTAAALRDWLHEAVRTLAGSPDPADAEAGAILDAYYLSGAGPHHQIACRLHLGRATYFRRLRRGVCALAVRLRAESATAVG